MTTIRSTFTPDGQRLFLDEFDGKFVVQTRWARVCKLDSFHEAVEAFDALQWFEGDLRRAYRDGVKPELKRLQNRIVGGSDAKMWAVLAGAEKRLKGLKPHASGSKGSVVVWA